MINHYRFKLKSDLLLATRGKIIFGFLMALLALVAAWGVSNFVFEEMITTVDKVSKPDEKLRLVNDIFNKVSRLDQNQRFLTSNKQNENTQFIKESRGLSLSLDTLKQLYHSDSLQLRRIVSIRKLLTERDKQFILYLRVRDSLLNTRNFSSEIEKLNEIFAERIFQSDSAIYTTENKTSTTTLNPENSKKGIFNKIFGKKKPESYKIVSEELKIRRDTLDEFAEDSILKNMEASLNLIKNKQQLKSKKFIEKESSLAVTSKKITQQMLTILEEVRNEALTQIQLNGQQARKVVNKGITQISFILIVFLLLTIVLTYFILTDIAKSNTYRLAIEKAKEEADYNSRAKQRFLANMSHEIRTPLQSIIGYSEIINSNLTPPKQAVEAIYQSSSHLLYLINEILDYSRITSGRFNLKSEEFELKPIIEEVLLIMQPLAQKKKIQLLTEIDFEDNIWLKGDAFRLKQILYNLLGNSIKFTNDGFVKLKLTINPTTALQTQLSFSVEDTGIGIKPESLHTIFDEFEHGLTVDDEVNSSGLGLSIVKQLVELHHGQISIESELNKGSVFKVKLNYQSSDKRKALFVKEENKSNTFSKNKTVWVIDDDQLILDLCAMILAKYEIPNKIFNKPKELINYSINPDLHYVLMDIRMPEIDGLNLFSILKKRLPNYVKFYAITAQVLKEEQENILNIGFDGIINKPFKENDLLNILKNKLPIPINFDPTILKTMTFGDHLQLKKILTRFTHECQEDVILLNENIVKKDKETSLLIVHRLAGRIAQIGYKELGYAFRKIEKELNAIEKMTDDLIFEIERNLKKLNTFIDYVKENNYSI